MRAVDYTGRRNGKIVAVKDVGTSPKGRMWLFKCDCGKTATYRAARVFSENIVSCGCQKAERCRQNLAEGRVKLFQKGHKPRINYDLKRWLSQPRQNGRFSSTPVRRVVTMLD